MTRSTTQALKEADGNAGPAKHLPSKKRGHDSTKSSSNASDDEQASKRRNRKPIASEKDVKLKQNDRDKKSPKEKHEPTKSESKPDYRSWPIADLKNELRARRLKISGSTSEQVGRLSQNDHDRSLPVKQAMEAAARKRREVAAPDFPAARKGGLPVKRRGFSEDMKDSFEREHKLMRFGPPVYDQFGYEYDPDKMSRRTSRPSKSAMMNSMERHIKLSLEDENRKWEIVFRGEKKLGGFDWDAFNARVAQDLEIPFHKVEPCDVEIWVARGLKAEAREFERSNVSKEEREHLMEISLGSALRK